MALQSTWTNSTEQGEICMLGTGQNSGVREEVSFEHEPPNKIF